MEKPSENAEGNPVIGFLLLLLVLPVVLAACDCWLILDAKEYLIAWCRRMIS